MNNKETKTTISFSYKNYEKEIVVLSTKGSLIKAFQDALIEMSIIYPELLDGPFISSENALLELDDDYVLDTLEIDHNFKLIEIKAC